MTQVEINPPKFVLFVNKPTLMVEPYRKYLVNQFRESFGYSGCPLVLELRGKEKPVEGEDPAPILWDFVFYEYPRGF